MKFPELFYCAT